MLVTRRVDLGVYEHAIDIAGGSRPVAESCSDRNCQSPQIRKKITRRTFFSDPTVCGRLAGLLVEREGYL